MHSTWIFFLKKRAFTFLLIGVSILVGLFSLGAISKESSPEVIIPVGIVTTTLRGASAEDMEKLVTVKLEQEILNVENIDKVTSSSREGVSIITAQFNASADIQTSIQNLKDAVDKAKPDLPEEVTTPIVNKINFSEQPILITSLSADVSPYELTKLADDLERELKNVSGVSKVSISGVRDREINVILHKDKLALYGLSLQQVVQAIASENASFPVGTITTGNIDYPINFAGSLETAENLETIVVGYQGSSPIYLRDVASTLDSLVTPKTLSRISISGKPSENAITLNIYKKSGADITVVGKAVQEKLHELSATGILQGTTLVTSFDGAHEVKRDLRELTSVGFETVLLVMAVLFLTLGWRESVVAGLSIPLSIVIAFIGLYVSGNTINFISLFSLILAIGILVDSGIVVAEAIHTRLNLYGNVLEASIATIKEYAWPLIAGTMTTVAVFAPLFFLSGVTGQFISSIPFTIIFVLIASIVVALGMVPIIATLLITHEKKTSRLTELQEVWFHRIQTWYKQFLHRMLRNDDYQKKFLRYLGVAFIAALMLPVTGLLKVQFFPQDDQTLVIVSVEKPQGTPLTVTDLSVRQVEEILYNNSYVTSFVTTVGEGSAFSNTNQGANTKVANITVLLGDPKARDKTSTEIVELLRKELAPVTGASVKVDQGNNGPPSGSPVVITFRGESLDELSLAAQKGSELLATIPGTRDIETSLKDDGIAFELSVDKAKASLYGVNAATIAQTLRGAVSGIKASTIKKNTTDIDILVKVDLNANFINPEDTNTTTLDAIKQLSIPTKSGTVLLGSLITTKLRESKAIISREDGKRVTKVTSELLPKATAVDVVSSFKAKASELNLPKTVDIKYGGETEEVEKTFKEMFFALLAGMAGMLGILVLEFNSFRYALYLLLTIPFSLIGVLGGLTMTGQTLSFSSTLGLIALAGVIINHAIILLDSILKRLESEQMKESPLSLEEVIVESSAIRLRPIILTTITTVVGMIPLAGVSALWGPLAFAIMFGLLFAMVLTLVLIPVFFYRHPGKKYQGMKPLTVVPEKRPLRRSLKKAVDYLFAIASHLVALPRLKQ